jgi:shikimate dehydrogenase
MEIDSNTRLLGLFGNPARHSVSPILQNHLINHYNLNFTYLSFEPDPRKIKDAFESARNLGFLGLNITMPFKEESINYMQKTSVTASIIGAVNTVKFTGEDRNAYGYSTDGNGVIKALEDKKFTWNKKNCLVLGAGGAARSAVFSMLKKPVSRIFIYDIVEERASMLLENFKLNIKRFLTDKDNNEGDDQEIKYSAVEKKISILSDLDQVEDKLDSIELIINCTPVGMDIEGFKDLKPVPDNWMLENKYIFDMVYKPVETEFLKKARKDGAAEIINGIDMLVSQGVYSFKIWFDIMPENRIIDEAKDKIKKHLSK